jgi:hypothetical protein
VVHADNQTEYADVVGVLDAVAATRDERGTPALQVTLSSD